MIRSRSFLFTDDHGKELQEEGLRLFDLSANHGDIHQFVSGYIPSHWHRELEVFVLLEGYVQVSIRDRTCRLKAGDGCFINTEVIHSFTPDVLSPCRYRSFVFGPDLIGGMPGSVFDTAYVRPLLENGAPFLKFQPGEEDREYFEQFDRAFQACLGEAYGYEFQVRDALSQIVLYAKNKSASAEGPSRSPVQEERLKAMLLWIDRHLENNITAAEVAGAANVCKRECQRIFNQYLHYSPVKYIQRRRILHAARLLSDTEGPITNVALSCGFPSPSYFTMQFRELMGSTPREYRAMVKERRSGQIED